MIVSERSDHTIITPFTDYVYHSTLSEQELGYIHDLAEQSRNGEKFGKNLAGNILEQRKSLDTTVNEQHKLFSFFAKHLENFVKYERQDAQVNGFGVEALWFNYMKANEFNPLHSHSGLISGIVMVKVPLEIAEELNTNIETNARCPGHLEFVIGEHIHRILPKEGQIYLFPSSVKHQVYPFSSNVERVTMSWNITEIHTDD